MLEFDVSFATNTFAAEECVDLPSFYNDYLLYRNYSGIWYETVVITSQQNLFCNVESWVWVTDGVTDPCACLGMVSPV